MRPAFCILTFFLGALPHGQPQSASKGEWGWVAPAEAEQPPPAVVARELYSLNVHDEHELLVGVLKVTEGEEVIDATTHFCAANGLTREMPKTQ